MTDTPKTAETGKQDKTSPEQSGEHEKVPEAAENIEHTLRRLLAERDKRREKNPGLYR